MRVRVTRCHACGGSKQLPSPTASVHCDYCGALADWDFSACAVGNAQPGPAYEALHRQLAPGIKTATHRHDFATCKALHGRLFARRIQLRPSSCSPRIVDPMYRARFLDYYTDTMTLRDFDDRIAAWTAVVSQRIAELRQRRWRTPGSSRSGSSRWP